MERLPTRRDLERLAAWSELHRADSLLRGELNRRLEEAAGTTLLEHEAIHRLVIAPGRRLTMFELADALLVSRSGATRLIDRLEKRGWVARRIAPHDRRVVRAELTREGAAAFAAHGRGVRRRLRGALRRPPLRRGGRGAAGGARQAAGGEHPGAAT